jgi:hypothetical protein
MNSAIFVELEVLGGTVTNAYRASIAEEQCVRLSTQCVKVGFTNLDCIPWKLV